MAEVVNVRMVVGSRRDIGGEEDPDPKVILGMIAFPDDPGNVEQMGHPAYCGLELHLKTSRALGVELNREYTVVFTPVS